MQQNDGMPRRARLIGLILGGVAVASMWACATPPKIAALPSSAVAAATNIPDTSAQLLACVQSVAADRGYTAVRDPQAYGYLTNYQPRFVAERRNSFAQKFVLVAVVRADSSGVPALWTTARQVDQDGHVLNTENALPSTAAPATPSGSSAPIWNAQGLPADALADLRAVRTTCPDAM